MIWNNPHYRTELDRRVLASLEAATWRTGIYWIRLTEATPAEAAAARDVLWTECHRCGDRVGVVLPAELDAVAVSLREIATAHARCPQTLLGARWELLVTLRLRAARAEQSDAETRPAGCLCTWEFGDSKCPVHPTCDECGCVECECVAQAEAAL